MNRFMTRGLLSAAAAGALACACTVGPDYRRPDAPTPPGFAELAGKDKGSTLSPTTADAPDLAAWWRRFDDPVLQSLVERALAGNLDLDAAASRVRQARAQEVVTGAAGLPQVNATGNSLRVNRSASADSPVPGLTGGGASGGAAGGGAGAGAAGGASSTGASGPSHINYFNVGLDAAWEVDLFGGVRRGVEAARDTTAAQVWSRRDSQVSIAAETANQYVQYRLAKARLVTLDADLKRQQGVFAVISDRAKTGFVTNLDVNQQRVQLANTQAQIPQVEAQATAAVHALGVLLAVTPESLGAELAAPRPLPPVPVALPVGLPSDLLRRRPDIRASERRLASANAQIGVQTAVLYPSVDLLGLGSFGSNDITRLFNGRNALSAGVGLVQWNLFAAGRNQANIRIAREQYVQAVDSYRTTVLRAFQDVEDGLSRYATDQRRWTALNGSFKAAQDSFVIAQQQYEVGLVDYTTVYNSEAALLQNQDQLTQADGALAQDVVSIYKALGGGWSADPKIDGRTGADFDADPAHHRAAATR